MHEIAGGGGASTDFALILVTTSAKAGPAFMDQLGGTVTKKRKRLYKSRVTEYTWHSPMKTWCFITFKTNSKSM